MHAGHNPIGNTLAVDEDRQWVYHMSAVGKGVDNVANVPFAIRLLLEKFDPHVRDGHRKTIVESDTTLRDRSAQSGHSRDI